MSERLVTIEEAAEHISCHPATIRRMVQRGEIPALKIGRQYRVRMSDLAPEFQSEKPVAQKAASRASGSSKWSRVLSELQQTGGRSGQA